MNRRMLPIALLLIAATLAVALATGAPAPDPDPAAHWPQWRGPEGTGASPTAEPPLEWSEERNVRWKVPIPGRGHASPVVWGDAVYLLTAVVASPEAAEPEDSAGERRRPMIAPEAPVEFVLLALDRESGKTLWSRTARRETPHEGTHPDGTWASASAVTDGRRVFAHFGSRGLYAYTTSGELLWEKDLGDMTTRNGFGEGSSPAIRGETLVLNWDHEGDSFVLALDAASGRELWRRERDEVTSWSTPLIVEAGERPQVVVSATGRIRSYDLETGADVWSAGGMTVNTIPTPIYAGGLLYATSGFRGNATRAIRVAGAQGDLDGTEAIVWTYDQDTPYVPSPLLYRDKLYLLKSNTAILTALEAATGAVRYGPERLPGIEGVYASPVGAAGRVYIAGRDGTTVVLDAGPEFKVVAQNRLDDGFDASPAIAGSDLLLRGRRYLYSLTASR